MTVKPLWHLEVAPLTSIPLTRGQFFTYASEIAVEPGALVSIPVTTRTLKGIVFATKDMCSGRHVSPRFTVKPITKVLREHFMTQEQLELAQFISTTYYTSLGRSLVHFVPQTTKSRTTTPNTFSPPHIARTSKNIIHTDEQKYCINNIVSATKPVYLFGPASSGKTEVYIQSILKLLAEKDTSGQALIIVPELTLIPQEIERYSEVFGREHIAVIHSHLSPGIYYDTWKKIADGSAKIILGTRQALFAPFKNLDMVIVDEEQDDAYKQWDMSPRYDGRHVAEELARLHKAILVFGSATPSIERYYKAQEGIYSLLTLSPLPKQPSFDIRLVNMRFERHNKNFSSLSEELVKEMTRVLKQKRQIFLFINRQGAGSCTLCESCNTTLRCSYCDRALVFDIPLNNYKCLHCSHTNTSSPVCTACGSKKFKNIGLGTQIVEKEVRKRFPYSTIARMDRQTMLKHDAQATMYKDFASGKISILIGTQMATKGWDLPNVALVGMIDADSLFAFPDFKTDENAYQHILQAAGRMARMGSNFPGTALIQTYYPENPTLLKVQSKDFSTFYTEISEQREMLKYPPYGKLLRIIVSHEDKAIAEKNIRKIYKKLLSTCEDDRKIRISEPAPPMISRVRNNFRQHIILRSAHPAFPDLLHNYLLSIAKDVILDINPISIL